MKQPAEAISLPILVGYIRQAELLKIIPFSSATLWRKVKAGTFVQPVKLSARVTAWPRAQVNAWMQEQEVRK